MAQLPSEAVPYTFSARVLIQPDVVTILRDGAPRSPDVVNTKLTITRRFEDDPRALEEESGTSDEEHSRVSSESLRASSRSTLRPSRSAASSRVTPPVASGRGEAEHSLSDTAPSRSVIPAPPIIHVSQSRKGTPARSSSHASSRQATPQPSSSSTLPESSRGCSQKPSSSRSFDFPSLEELSSLLKNQNRRVTRSVSRSSLNIEQCRPDTPDSSANKVSGNTYRTAPVIDDDDDDFSQYERVTKKCLQTDGEKSAGTKYLTAWFYSEAGYSLSAPPTGMAKHPRLEVGDIFFHVVTHLEEPQMWIWVEASGGRRSWKVVVKGESRREDNRRLTVALDSKKNTKKPVWVSDTWYKKMVIKDTAKSKGKEKATG